MRGFLLIFFCTFFPPFECQDSGDNLNLFYVTRRYKKEAICIWPYESIYYAFPTFNLDKLQIPQDVGFQYWDWLVDWHLQNNTNVRRGDTKILVAGNQPFHFVGRGNLDDGFLVYILASNISLWVADENRPFGNGLLFELDFWNKTTQLKDTTMKYCNQNPQSKNATCTILGYKNGTNHLNDGNRWTWFWTKFKENNFTEVEMCEMSFGNWTSVVQWNVSTTNISYPFTAEKVYSVFAKSHQRNAALETHAYDQPYFENKQQMERNFTKRNSGKLCVYVEWSKRKSNDSQELLEVKNLVSGRVEPGLITSDDEWYTKFQWNHLDAGDYETTLRFDKREPWRIDLCQDQDSKIRRTWTSIPKAIIKCQFGVGDADEYSAWKSSTPNPHLKPDWTLGDWEHVCDRLGIGSNDTTVPIKFCNLHGCNFSNCPHLQLEPSSLFDI